MTKIGSKTQKSFFSPGVIAGLLAVAGLLAAATVIWLYTNRQQSAIKNQGTQTQEPLPSGKTETTKTDEAKPDVPGDKTSDGITTQPAKPTPSTAEMNSIFQSANGELVVQTKVIGVSTGTCNLSVTVGAQTVQKSAPIIYQAEYSTCAGFSIPVSELTAGSATLRLSVVSDNKEVATDQKTSIIKK